MNRSEILADFHRSPPMGGVFESGEFLPPMELHFWEERRIKTVMVRRFAFVLLCATVVVGCGHNKRSRRTVLERASFDFPCAKDDIELFVLDQEGARNLYSQIGVQGCEKRAVYVFSADIDTWVLNGVVLPSSADDPPVHHSKAQTKKEKRAEKKNKEPAAEPAADEPAAEPATEPAPTE